MLKLLERIAEKVGAVTNRPSGIGTSYSSRKLVEQIEKATETAGTKP